MTSELELSLLGQLRMTQPRVSPPVREYRFHPVRRWRFDLAWPEIKLAVEIDGGTFSGGRHTRGAGVDNDCEKLCEATLAGWTVLKVTGTHVHDGRARMWTERAYKALSDYDPASGEPVSLFASSDGPDASVTVMPVKE